MFQHDRSIQRKNQRHQHCYYRNPNSRNKNIESNNTEQVNRRNDQTQQYPVTANQESKNEARSVQRLLELLVFLTSRVRIGRRELICLCVCVFFAFLKRVQRLKEGKENEVRRQIGNSERKYREREK